MQSTAAILALVAVAIAFILVLGISNLMLSGRKARARHVRRRVRALARTEAVDFAPAIERTRRMSDVDWLDKALAEGGWSRRLDIMLEQAQAKTTVAGLVATCAIAGAGAFLVAQIATGNLLLQLAATGLFAYAPLWRIRRKRAKRMQAFARQLPDALDLIARALKAGHAFNQGMRMVADEFEDPIGPEFHKTLEEINFGVGVGRALVNLTHRVDCTDLKFFVVSVNIQRETGGNLSEIVGNIARLVRERFKFQGRVKVLSAEGKLTAYILVALPFAIGVVINLINPEYMGQMFESPIGRGMMTMAGVQMALGALVLKKLITIRV